MPPRPHNFRSLRRVLSTLPSVQFEQLDPSLLPELYPNPGILPPIQKTLLRPPTLALRNVIDAHLNPSSTSPQPSLYIVDGPKGVGKTSILQQTVAYARIQGLTVLYLPNARNWSYGNDFFAGVAVKGKDPLLDGVDAVKYYDRPGEIAKVFDGLMNAHGDTLGSMKCDPELKTEKTEDCEDMLALLERGKEFLRKAESDWRESCEGSGDVFDRVIRELGRVESGVVVVVDGFEWLIGMTCMQNEKRERLHSNGIRAVAEHFGRNAIEGLAGGLKKGFVVLATDEGFGFEEWRRSRVKGGVEYPLGEEILGDISGRSWLKGLKERVDETGGLIAVPELSNMELKALCSTFVKGGVRKLVEGEEAEEADRILALAGGRADIMKRIAVSR